MSKNKNLTELEVEEIVSTYNFKKLYHLFWSLHFRYSYDPPISILENFLKSKNINFTIKSTSMGELTDHVIYFSSPEDEGHFIIVINSLKN